MTMDKPPKGWPEKLTVTEYDALDVERKNYYSGIFAKYRTKKYRAYGEYGEFEGWQPMQVGIGKPIAYKYHGVIMAKVIDSVLNSNILANRISGNKKKWH